MNPKLRTKAVRKSASKVPWRIVRQWGTRQHKPYPVRNKSIGKSRRCISQRASYAVLGTDESNDELYLRDTTSPDDEDQNGPALNISHQTPRDSQPKSKRSENGIRHSKDAGSSEAPTARRQEELRYSFRTPALSPGDEKHTRMRTMLHRIIIHMRQTHESNWTLALQETDYTFSDPVSHSLATTLLQEHNPSNTHITPLTLLQHAYKTISENGLTCDDRRHHAIHLTFTGTLSPQRRHHHSPLPRPKVSLWSILSATFPNQHPLFPHQLQHLSAALFFHPALGPHALSEWRARYAAYFQRAPFMLRGNGWMLFWGLLLFGRRGLLGVLGGVGVGVGRVEEWAGRGMEEELLGLYDRETVGGEGLKEIRRTLGELCRFLKGLRMEGGGVL
ncbi:hypothetical protein BS50DRAFT_664381 [Corynespora cassiicola Philippines]|uniref:Uncharacterized protein n=1 Tax=Corynespora cassiicola Philippines TaxID=1448308 RepID=A0A2T2NWF9_CORCC|nr:hypothetical protein BS50DRAFT_664381 [Corynespora cassiicola Philippines]